MLAECKASPPASLRPKQLEAAKRQNSQGFGASERDTAMNLQNFLIALGYDAAGPS